MIAVGTPIARTSTVITSTSDRRERSRARLRINGGEGKLLSRLTKGLRSKMSGSVPHCLYHRGKTEVTVQNPRLGYYAAG
jgi:hypothetical protein